MLLPAKPLFGIDFEQGTRTPRPTPPPGHAYDGQTYDDPSALYPAFQQVTALTLGGSTVTSDVTTLVIYPVQTGLGSPWAASIEVITLTFTTGATQTLAAVAAGLAANAVAQQTVSSLADVANYNRIYDFLTVTAAGDVVTLTTRDAGATFTWLLSSTGSVTEGSQVTTGNVEDLLRVGVIGVQSAIAVNGDLQIDDTGAGRVLGLVMVSSRVRARNPGDQFDAYARGVYAVYREYGTGTALAEKAVTADAQVYRRTTVGAGQVAGAVTDTPTVVLQITTGVPSVVNTTLYNLAFTITDLFTGAVKASGFANYTSDASATAAEIVDNMITNIGTQAASVDALITTANVADELKITVGSGCVLAVSDLGGNFPFGADAPAASSEHTLVPAARFLETTPTGSTSAPIVLAHP